MEIIHPNYRWNGAPTKRSGPPPGIVWHHTDGYGSAETVHQIHRNIGDKGIAYQLYVRLDGKVYAGRPLDTWGAHTLGHNDWIGVAAEGRYEKAGAIMPSAQLASLQDVHAFLTGKYGAIPDRKHKDMQGNSTACPGRYYPFNAVVSGKPVRKKMSRDKVQDLVQGRRTADITWLKAMLNRILGRRS